MLLVESFCAVAFHIIVDVMLNFNRTGIFSANVFEAVALGVHGNC